MLRIYNCSDFDNCRNTFTGPLFEVFPGYDADKVDSALYENKLVFFYNDNVIEAFELTQAQTELDPPIFEKGAFEVEVGPQYVNNTDASFKLPQLSGFAIKGYKLYLSAINNGMTYLGVVTAPCKEENLEENELPPLFAVA